MRLLFTNSAKRAGFFPRQVAGLIPFSSQKLLEIFNHFSIEPNSVEAAIMKYTIEACEEPITEGEGKCCATSLESLIDLNLAKLGTKLSVISTEIQAKKQDYTISGEVKMVGDKVLVCHKMKYAYAVFYYHLDNAINIYMVPLMDADGTKAKALVVCHTNTSAWSPEHLVLLVLKVKPAPPICPFDTLVWVQN